jgi:predicted DCC family thiol-disulfide oxidoreductase YuxK
MTSLEKLTLFYDGTCPLCQAEILYLSRRNQAGLLDFVDIHSERYDPNTVGVSCEQALAAMYGQYANGKLIQGVEVFPEAYRRANLPVMAWVSWRRRSWAPVAGLLLVLLFETGMTGSLKVAIGRTFPYDHYYYENVDVNVGEMAFPSGHAANVIALLGYAVWHFSRAWRRPARLIGWSCIGLAAIDVGVSSWLIQTHWPTDLFAGYAIGAIALLAVVALLNALGLNPSATAQRSPTTHL